MNYHTRRYEHSCCPNDPGFVSNYWVREYICFQPLPSWLCVRLKQSTLLSRVSALNRKMIWCKRQIISQKITVQYIANLDLCLFSQPSPPFFLRSTSPHDFSPPGRLEGFHQLDLSDEESARQPTAMHKWLGFVSLSCAHDVFEYTTYVCMQP